MTATAEQGRRWREDAITLGHVGAELGSVRIPTVRVRFSSAGARRALDAWQRDDGAEDGDGSGPESFEQRIVRMRAGTLALVGLAIEERGRWDDDGVSVDLAADLVVMAVDAADDRALWERGSPSGPARE